MMIVLILVLNFYQPISVTDICMCLRDRNKCECVHTHVCGCSAHMYWIILEHTADVLDTGV